MAGLQRRRGGRKQGGRRLRRWLFALFGLWLVYFFVTSLYGLVRAWGDTRRAERELLHTRARFLVEAWRTEQLHDPRVLALLVERRLGLGARDENGKEEVLYPQGPGQ